MGRMGIDPRCRELRTVLDPGIYVRVVSVSVVAAGGVFLAVKGVARGSASLDPAVRTVVSEAFGPSTVGPAAFKAGLAGLARDQKLLVAALGAGERLRLIAPCVAYGRYEGAAVVTDLRVFEFRRRVWDQVPLGRITSTRIDPHPDGFVVVETLGRDFAMYGSGVTDWQLEINAHNHVRFRLPTAGLARHLVDTVDGLRGERPAA
jgi:hypothetical protein